MRRREFLTTIATAPAIIAAAKDRPLAAQGVQIGDVVPGHAVIWSRSDRAADMVVEWSTTESFRNPKKITGYVIADSDFTGRVDLTGLPLDQQIFFRVTLRAGSVSGEPILGKFRAAPASRRNVRFVWSGDTVGQGWGINPEQGGMRIYETMRGREPDFFVHSGDTIYADGPVVSEVKLADGSVWKNLVTEAKSKVAESLGEFRGNYLYNFLDVNVRRFNAEVPQIWQWDDHEVMNNWSPAKPDIATIVGRARQAFLEYAPIRQTGSSAQVYRRIPYGPLLDVFVIDMRSYRGPNTFNRQERESADTRYLGTPQLDWLQQGLKASKAVWKVIASDMPIGLIVGDGKDSGGRPMFENSSNGDGPALGRELEIARLLRSVRQVRNMVWITADTHYTAAHRYSPEKAQFTDFSPFWEFVSGPLNAGTFGPNALDNTFGPEVVFVKAPPKGQVNLPPSAGMQFFGEVEIDGRTAEMAVHLKDVSGATLFTQKLAPLR